MSQVASALRSSALARMPGNRPKWSNFVWLIADRHDIEADNVSGRGLFPEPGARAPFDITWLDGMSDRQRSSTAWDCGGARGCGRRTTGNRWALRSSNCSLPQLPPTVQSGAQLSDANAAGAAGSAQFGFTGHIASPSPAVSMHPTRLLAADVYRDAGPLSSALGAPNRAAQSQPLSDRDDAGR